MISIHCLDGGRLFEDLQTVLGSEQFVYNPPDTTPQNSRIIHITYTNYPIALINKQDRPVPVGQHRLYINTTAQPIPAGQKDSDSLYLHYYKNPDREIAAAICQWVVGTQYGSQ